MEHGGPKLNLGVNYSGKGCRITRREECKDKEANQWQRRSLNKVVKRWQRGRLDVEEGREGWRWVFLRAFNGPFNARGSCLSLSFSQPHHLKLSQCRGSSQLPPPPFFTLSSKKAVKTRSLPTMAAFLVALSGSGTLFFSLG